MYNTEARIVEVVDAANKYLLAVETDLSQID
ncbi:MAG: hypothetical protein ACI9G1_000379 [Pirellulaceae bacterium]|jgi:hypothetical protein